VSTGINHLLKSPFCIHPKTGNICVPFDAAKVENFRLADVPTLTMVINELGQSAGRSKQKSEEGSEVASLPCLEPYIAIFKKHIRACVVKQEKHNRTLQGGGNSMDF
jgi:DNA primase small subunit